MAKLTAPQRQVAQLFLQGGCVREPDEDRMSEGHRSYKKGWEVRLYADSRAEAAQTRQLLRRAGVEAGRPYKKSKHRWIVPVYGRERVDQILEWVNAVG